MAKARKKKTPVKKESFPPHPRVPLPKEIGELCADIYRDGVRQARQLGLEEQVVEQLAMEDVRQFMAACIKQSKADWKAYSRSTGVLAAFVKPKAKRRK